MMPGSDDRKIARDTEIFCGWLGDLLFKMKLINAPWRRFTRDGLPPMEYVSFAKRMRAVKHARELGDG